MVKKLAPEQKRSSQSASQKRGNIASDHHPGFEPCPRGFEGRREPLKQDRERSKPKDTSFQQPSQIDRMDKQVKASAARAPRHSQTEQSERGRTPDQYLALKKQEAIERFMAAFNEWLEKRLAIVNYAYGAAESAGTPSGGSYEDGGGGQAGRDTSRRPKRQLGGDEKDNSSAGGDENGGDRGGNKRAKKDAEIERKWACPFYKHDPRAHSGRRSCAGPGWTSIHRLKEHIYRIHRLPKHTCPRCNKPFDDSKDLSEHLRADTLCEKLNVAPSEGIDETTEAKLKVRKRHSPGVSDEQRWREIYLILFPDANPDATPSPYYDGNDSLGYVKSSDAWKKVEKRIRRDLPKLVRKKVERKFEKVELEVLQGFDDIIRDGLSEIFRDCPGDDQSTLTTPAPTTRASTPGFTTAPQQSSAVLTEEVNNAPLDLSYFFEEPDLPWHLGGFDGSDFKSCFELDDAGNYRGFDKASDSGYASTITPTRDAYLGANF